MKLKMTKQKENFKFKDYKSIVLALIEEVYFCALKGVPLYKLKELQAEIEKETAIKQERELRLKLKSKLEGLKKENDIKIRGIKKRKLLT